MGDKAHDEAPTFSLQGDRLMFFRVVSDTDTCQCEIWLANADGSAAHKLAAFDFEERECIVRTHGGMRDTYL